MNEVSHLSVLLHGREVGTITYIGGQRTLFSFNEAYVEDTRRFTLGLRFKDRFGQLITEFRPYKIKLMPFFSNLLPEGVLRTYLARQADVHPDREFFLLEALGRDLAGALSVLHQLCRDSNEGVKGSTSSPKSRKTVFFVSPWQGSSSNFPPSKIVRVG